MKKLILVSALLALGACAEMPNGPQGYQGYQPQYGRQQYAPQQPGLGKTLGTIGGAAGGALLCNPCNGWEKAGSGIGGAILGNLLGGLADGPRQPQYAPQQQYQQYPQQQYQQYPQQQYQQQQQQGAIAWSELPAGQIIREGNHASGARCSEIQTYEQGIQTWCTAANGGYVRVK